MTILDIVSYDSLLRRGCRSGAFYDKFCVAHMIITVFVNKLKIIMLGMGLVATLFISDVNEKSEDNIEMAKEVEMVPGIMEQVSNTRGL